MNNNSKQQIIVLGAGGHGKSVLSMMQASGYTVHGILDDNEDAWGAEILGVPVLGGLSMVNDHIEKEFIMGFGDNKIRRAFANKHPDLKWATIKSPLAYINPSASIAKGTVIFPFAVIAADVSLGAHTIASTHITVGHDTIVKDFVHMAPSVQIAGGAHLEEGVMLGIGSIVCPEVHIGKNSILGAGAVAVKDIPSGCTAFGMPAKVVSKT